MGPEVFLYVVGGLMVGGVIVRWALKSITGRDVSPVSDRWLLEQRGRPDIW